MLVLIYIFIHIGKLPSPNFCFFSPFTNCFESYTFPTFPLYGKHYMSPIFLNVSVNMIGKKYNFISLF